MNMAEIRQNPVWGEILAMVAKELDTASKRVVTAAADQPMDQVRYLAGQHAGMLAVYNYLRGL